MWENKAKEVSRHRKGRVNVKIVEYGGIPLKNTHSKIAPKEQSKCSDNNCKVCSFTTSKTMICRETRGGIGYDIQCNLQRKKPKTAFTMVKPVELYIHA